MSYILGKVLYYFNLFNILHFDCPALPLHLEFTASVNCGDENRLPKEKKSYKMLKIEVVICKYEIVLFYSLRINTDDFGGHTLGQNFELNTWFCYDLSWCVICCMSVYVRGRVYVYRNSVLEDKVYFLFGCQACVIFSEQGFRFTCTEEKAQLLCWRHSTSKPILSWSERCRWPVRTVNSSCIWVSKKESEYGWQTPLVKIQGNFMECNIDVDCWEKAVVIRSENQTERGLIWIALH